MSVEKAVILKNKGFYTKHKVLNLIFRLSPSSPPNNFTWGTFNVTWENANYRWGS